MKADIPNPKTSDGFGSKGALADHLNHFHPTLNIHRLSSCIKLAKIPAIV
jgi:hypothetical protein